MENNVEVRAAAHIVRWLYRPGPATRPATSPAATISEAAMIASSALLLMPSMFIMAGMVGNRGPGWNGGGLAVGREGGRGLGTDTPTCGPRYGYDPSMTKNQRRFLLEVFATIYQPDAEFTTPLIGHRAGLTIEDSARVAEELERSGLITRVGPLPGIQQARLTEKGQAAAHGLRRDTERQKKIVRHGVLPVWFVVTAIVVPVFVAGLNRRIERLEKKATNPVSPPTSLPVR